MKQEMRRIIKIDRDLCTGCGLCVTACHEGAIGLVDGKAQLMHEHYCDGLGDCLPACPTGAITFEERMAASYDEDAVKAAMAAKAAHASAHTASCPGSAARFLRDAACAPSPSSGNEAACEQAVASRLAQWPCQIKLVSPAAPYFQGADLLIAADCTAFAYGAFHRDFMAGKVTIVGCPKLDGVDYTNKLAEIVAANDIRSVTVARMVVPCCGGLEQAARNAVALSGKDIPFEVRTIGTDGTLL